MYYSDYNRPPTEGGGATPPRPDLSKGKAPKWAKILALALAVVLLGGAAGVCGTLAAQRIGALASIAAEPSNAPQTAGGDVAAQPQDNAPAVDLAQVNSGEALTPAEVYAANVNSVVGIITQTTTNIWGQQVASAAAGSGFVLTADGYIVTNHHVVEDATSITVQFKNGEKMAATLVGSEADNDVALLKVDATGLSPVRLGSSSSLVVGQDVVAIGNPLGEMTFSLTRGVISALDKALTMSDGAVLNVLQTDTAINPGNSGGPLFNMYGQVVGITNAKYTKNGSTPIEGIGFAIPIDDVKDLLQDIMEHGYVTGKPYMGVTFSTANAAEAARYGRAGGAYVQSVVPGAAADKAGLRQGDIVTAVDGQAVDGQAAILEIRDQHKAGDTVTLTVDREAKLITLTLTFGEQTPETQNSQSSQNSQNSQSGYGSFDPFEWFGW